MPEATGGATHHPGPHALDRLDLAVAEQVGALMEL